MQCRFIKASHSTASLSTYYCPVNLSKPVFSLYQLFIDLLSLKERKAYLDGVLCERTYFLKEPPLEIFIFRMERHLTCLDWSQPDFVQSSVQTDCCSGLRHSDNHHCCRQKLLEVQQAADCRHSYFEEQRLGPD